MQYFVGLDVALRSLALCIIDGEGEIVLEQALLCEVEGIASEIHSNFDSPLQKNTTGQRSYY